MCGIIGIVSDSAVADRLVDGLKRMVDEADRGVGGNGDHGGRQNPQKHNHQSTHDPASIVGGNGLRHPPEERWPTFW